MDKIELEQLIASQICQEPALLSSLTVALDDFGDWRSKTTIDAIERMERDGVRVTRADMSRYIPDMDRSAIATLWGFSTSRSNYTKHVQALADMVKAEKLETLSRVITGSLGQKMPPDEIITAIEEHLFTITKQSAVYQPVNMGEAIMQAVEHVEWKSKHPGLPGVTTGYNELDDSFGGFEPGKLYYVGARPSQGKTALMLNFALHALKAGSPIGIISIESNVKELADRMLSINGTINSMDMKRGRLRPSDYGKISNTAQILYEKPGQLYHNPYASIADLSIQARRMVRNHDSKVIFVDYVQLVSGGKEWITKPRHLEVAYVSRNLKGLASEIGVPIVCLAQIGRSAEGKAPTMADFAESSALEKDADVMMAIHHEEREGGEEYSAIKILKARDGLTGEAPVKFTREFLRFTEVSGI